MFSFEVRPRESRSGVRKLSRRQRRQRRCRQLISRKWQQIRETWPCSWGKECVATRGVCVCARIDQTFVSRGQRSGTQRDLHLVARLGEALRSRLAARDQGAHLPRTKRRSCSRPVSVEAQSSDSVAGHRPRDHPSMVCSWFRRFRIQPSPDGRKGGPDGDLGRESPVTPARDASRRR
jgi:hypothetical protein